MKKKKWLPTFNPEDFDLKNRSVEEIIQVSCQAEMVHEAIMQPRLTNKLQCKRRIC